GVEGKRPPEDAFLSLAGFEPFSRYDLEHPGIVQVRGRFFPRTSSRLLQFPELDIAKADLVGSLALGDAVDLQTDEATHHARFLIHEVRDGHVVDPRLDRLALGDDTVFVPLAILEGLARFGDVRVDIEPAGGQSLAPDAAGVAVGGNLDLRTVDAFLLLVVLGLRADLHAGIQLVIDLDLELQLEVAVILGGAKERVWASLARPADNAAVLDAILGGAVALFPAVERLAVEQFHPALAVPVRGGARNGTEKQGRHDDAH